MRGPVSTGAGIVLALSLATAAAATPPLRSAAQRPPPQKQVLTELAYVLGESHGVRRLCNGPTDGFWYERMMRLLTVEQPDDGFRRRLTDRFNAGFVAAGARFTTCSTESRSAGEDAALRGKSLAARLASSDDNEAVSH